MLLGRDRERAEIWALLEAARSSRSGALVLRGEAGAGKTALLEDARDRATDMHVVRARGVESESELPFAAIHQLLRPALAHLDRIPPPQAEALGSALGLGAEAAQERFLVFAACLSLLSELAEHRPVLCLVDDAHWLDAASSDALKFVARRLDAEGIVMLFGAREGDVRSFEVADVPSLMIGPLDAGAANELLVRGANVAPSVVESLLVRSGGNALALVELPSALSTAQLSGEQPLPALLPMTRQLDSVFLGRVRRLPDATQMLLLVAAADDSETLTVVSRAADLLQLSPRAFDAAEKARLVAIRGDRVEFRHPLVRSAIYEAASSSERRTVHRALAAALERDDVHADRRAWHLAAATVDRDEQAVRALEEAAERAEKRIGYRSAARAFARAAELSADGTARAGRLVRAARAARIAGADGEAMALAKQAEPLVEDPLDRAEVARVIGAAGVRSGRPLDGLPGLVRAANEVAELDPPTAVALLGWAIAAAFTGGDLAAVAEVSSAAEALVAVGGHDHEDAVHPAQAIAVFSRALEGDIIDSGELDRPFAWASESDDAQAVYMISAALGVSGDATRSEVLMTRALLVARAQGELGTLAEALVVRAIRHMRAQRFEAAASEAEEGVRFARELGATNVAARGRSIRAYVAAVRGQDDEARREAEDVLDLADANGLGPTADFALHALALLDLGRGRWPESLERFENMAYGRREGEPFQAKVVLPDLVEAAVRAGRLDEAARAVAALEDSGAGVWPARIASCRALVADGDEAGRLFEEALGLAGPERPFDLARIHLLYGEHLRRARRRTDARRHFREALESFERLRAEPWAERARAELRATGETARKRDASTVDQLTAQELQISRYVAEGMSNKEIAALLFLSPRTIDSHLRNVFSKLGIKSRTQLARLELGGEAVPVASRA